MPLDAFWKDLRYGFRMLARQPGFTVVAVLTLALGIGATTAIFSVVHAVLLRPLPYTQPERLVVAWEVDDDGSTSNTSFTTLHDWRERSRTLQLSAVRGWSAVLTGEGHAERVAGLRVSHDYFEVLGTRLLLGRGFLPAEDTPENWRVVVLSHDLWQRRFGGDPRIVGRVIRLTNTEYKVVGVLPPDFRPLISAHFYEQGEIWAPLGYGLADPFACRTCRHLRAVGRVRPEATLEKARAEMEAIATQLFSEHPAAYPRPGAILTPLQDELGGHVRPALLILLGAVALVLLIACANVANLLLARAAQRQREMGIRAALGAGRARLARQLLTESLLLALGGGALGLLLASWGIEFLLAMSPAELPLFDQVRLDGAVLTFALTVSLLTALLFGAAPAGFAQRLDPVTALKEGGRSSAGAGPRRLRSVLVAANLAVALVLLAGAGLLLESFMRVLRVDPGFDTGDVLTARVSALGPRYQEEAAVADFCRQVIERVAALPGVEAAGASTQIPLGGNFDRSGLHIEGRPLANPALAPSAERYGIAGDYLRAMRIPLLRGRAFTEADTAESEEVVLINQALARAFWPGEDPVGRRIRLGGETSPWRTIVGVVGDVRHYRLEEPPNFQAYLPHAQWAGPFLNLAIRGRAPARLADAVRREIRAVDADLPVYGLQTLDETRTAAVAERRFTMLLLGIFAAVAVALAAVGLYGVMAYQVAQRTREIGIRMALGAGRGHILRMVVGQGLALTAAGVAAGLAAAAGLTQLLRSQLYGVAPADAGIFAGVAALLAAVALVACWLPARRAARVHPMAALRHE